MGVAFLPLHFYYNPGHPNHEKLFIVLGKERAGPYANYYNFIGGAGSNGENEHTTLNREVAEELGLVLNDDLVRKCLIKRVRVKGTSFFGCHVTGLSGRKWHKMMQARGNCPWELQEMSDIQHFPVAELNSNPYISSYVCQFIPLIYDLAAKVLITEPVHYSQFMAVAPRSNIPML